jgi:hypothetical protein
MCDRVLGSSPWSVSHSEPRGYHVHLCAEHARDAAYVEGSVRFARWVEVGAPEEKKRAQRGGGRS